MDLHKISAAQIAAKVKSGTHWPERIAIGIDGPGGSGKSTLADALSTDFREAIVVHLDDFYLPSNKRDPVAIAGNYDLDRLRKQVLMPFREGMSLRYQRYDWPSDSLAEWINEGNPDVLIVEGIYATASAVANFYDYTIYCTAARQTRLNRGLARDGKSAMDMWTKEWMPREDEYITQQAPDLRASLAIVCESQNPEGTSYTEWERRRNSRPTP